MPIPVRCSCGRTLAVKEEHAGKKVRCPVCRAVLEVPARAVEEGARTCPGCGEELASSAVVCVNCGYDTRTGKKHESAIPSRPREAERRASSRAERKSPTSTPRPSARKASPVGDLADVRAYRSWGWLIISLCLAGAVGAVAVGVMTGLVSVHKGLPEAAGAQAWELLKPVGLFFMGAIAGAFLGGQAAKILPK